MTGFGDDIGDNFKEFFRPSARGPVNSDAARKLGSERRASGRTCGT